MTAGTFHATITTTTTTKNTTTTTTTQCPKILLLFYCPYLLQTLTDFLNFVTDAFCRQLALVTEYPTTP